MKRGPGPSSPPSSGTEGQIEAGSRAPVPTPVPVSVSASEPTVAKAEAVPQPVRQHAPPPPPPAPDPVVAPAPAAGRARDPLVELPYIEDPRTPQAATPPAANVRADVLVAPVEQDGWVDQILLPTPLPQPARPPRPRPRLTPRSTAKRASAAVATARFAGKTAARKTAARRSAATPSYVTPVLNKPVDSRASSAPRWWLVALLLTVIAVAVFERRPREEAHDPVPPGIMGVWTTTFPLYENQTLEIRPDTVVATLDEVDEGRYPITKVEVTEQERDRAMRITYQVGEDREEVLDFLADRDRSSTLRFRSHGGPVWVRAPR